MVLLSYPVFLSVTILLILLINFLSDGKVETVFIIESNAALGNEVSYFLTSGHLKPAQNLSIHFFINGVMIVKSFFDSSNLPLN
jgi:hypothetical protein